MGKIVIKNNNKNVFHNMNERIYFIEALLILIMHGFFWGADWVFSVNSRGFIKYESELDYSRDAHYFSNSQNKSMKKRDTYWGERFGRKEKLFSSQKMWYWRGEIESFDLSEKKKDDSIDGETKITDGRVMSHRIFEEPVTLTMRPGIRGKTNYVGFFFLLVDH
ncbi:hypothetical protein EDC94DRAFT_579482 [Helicostylum pulchrum]|nr:hypothetical protein EDC94DRAFT_579482 [Helicostylum pulchrum]